MLKRIEQLLSKNRAMTFIAFAIFIILGLSITGFSDLFGDFSTSAISTGSSRVAVTLSDIITLHILDSSASSEINNLMLDVTPTPNGVFTKNSMIVEAATSNPTGYKLYMSSIGTNPVDTSPETESGSSGDSGNSGDSSYTTDLINTNSDITDSISTLDSGVSVTEADFRVRNSLYKNKWGYSLASLDITDTSAITYTDIPANTEQRLIDEKIEQTEHGQTPVTIGVNVSSSIASGTYKNKLEFTAVANPIPVDYKLKFNSNTTAATKKIPETMTETSTASSVDFIISSDVPYDDTADLTFLGWSEDKDDTGADPSTLYQPGDTYTLVTEDSSAGGAPGEATLYAVWGAANYWNITYMQEMTSNICGALKKPSNVTGTNATGIALTGESGESGITFRYVDDMAGYNAIVTADNQPYVAQRILYDIRDNNKYTVRKLADGNCWMTSNLKLELSTSKSVAVVANKTGELAPATPASAAQQGAIDENGLWIPTGSGSTGNAATPMNGNTIYDSTYDLWYYSWYAATAGSGTASMVNQDAPYSICPKGWRLPANYSYNEDSKTKSFGSITNAYLGTTESTNTRIDYKRTMEAFPLSFLSAGYTESGSYNGDKGGFCLSSTAYSSATEVYRLRFGTTAIWAQGADHKHNGFNVRCVTI